MVGICGLEPQTSSLSVTRSNQLSYIPIYNGIYEIKSFRLVFSRSEALFLIEQASKNAKMGDFNHKLVE